MFLKNYFNPAAGFTTWAEWETWADFSAEWDETLSYAYAAYVCERAEAHPETAERVAWTETRNLATDHPGVAREIMIATARQADELKAAAGVKSTGRKSSAHVYAYSLAWHPDEAGALDRAEMTRAADASLKVLGAEHHQAVIVCHQDQKHPHVHVIVNRVDPATGKMLSTSNDRLKLSDWANAYERERGVILTPKREEKRELREKFAQQAERQAYAAEKRQQAAETPLAEKSPVAVLKALGAAQRDQHRQEWKDLSAGNKATRDRIFTDSGRAIREATERHKAECRPIWAKFFRETRQAQSAYLAREQSLAGVIRNALDATTHQRVSGQLGNRGTLAATFGNVLSSQARAAAFAEVQDMNRGQLAHRLKSVLDSEVRAIKEQRGAALVAQRQAFDRSRASLIERQDLERGKIRQAWQQLPRDRGGDRQPDRAKPYRSRWQDATRSQEQKPMKRPFDDARGIEAKQPLPTKTAFISQVHPAPSPAGEVPRAVPRVAQEIAQKPTPATTPARVIDPKQVFADSAKKPARDPQQDFGSASRSDPAPKNWNVTPAPAASSAKKDWGAAAPEQDRELKRLPARSQERDPEPER